MKMAIVEWDDAYGNSGWTCTIDDSGLETIPVITIGLVKKETDSYISLIQTKGHDIYTGSMTIPKGMVKRIRYLRIRR